MNIGKAIGGPVSGVELRTDREMLVVPTRVGPDRGEGDRGFGMAYYIWRDGAWLYIDPALTSAQH